MPDMNDYIERTEVEVFERIATEVEVFETGIQGPPGPPGPVGPEGPPSPAGAFAWNSTNW